MKSLTRLLGKVLEDSSTWCSTSTTRDLVTVTRRVEHEGLSFLMITLPNFCADFERSLAEGKVTDDMFAGFGRHGALPRFLGGLLRRVFNTGDGTLLDDPDVNAIYFIRQVCLISKKIEHPCSDARVSEAWRRFVQTNDEVRQWETDLNDVFRSRWDSDTSTYEVGPQWAGSTPPQMHSFREVATLAWNETVFPPDLFRPESLVPRHGPGATAERVSANRKYEQTVWHRRLEPYFPLDLFGVPSWNFTEELEKYTVVTPELETPVRVVQVPKTLKTPRIIAIEPVCMQYTQQALLEVVVPLLETSRAFAGALGFTDQTVNQKLALASSADGRLATIDLKDASDRVSAQLVFEMLAHVPLFRDALFACRSIRADVPEHGVIPLYRFASMGSAMCFPVEAMVFYTIVVSAIARSMGTRLTPKLLREISGSVRIYGDDIIVPVEYVQQVKSELEWFNLRVNANKTFGTGKFRESCGMDAYGGTDVTPRYQRQALPTSPLHTQQIISAVSLRNQLYKAGCWKATAYLDTLLERLIPFPTVLDTSALLGRKSFLGLDPREPTRWDANLHYNVVKGVVVKARARASALDGPGALMKHFLKRGKLPFKDKKHLAYAGRPVSVYTKKQWALPW